MKALAEALEGSEVSELDLTEEGVRVHVRRRLDAPVYMPAARAMAPAHRPARTATRRHSEAATAPKPAEAGVAIVAPLTGVFYGSPSPTSAPFAQVGETVQAGQVVCIVEAMKVFNEIKSEVSGTVLAIVAQNGQLVQKGEALIRVQPI